MSQNLGIRPVNVVAVLLALTGLITFTPADARSIDGSNNNVVNPTWGVAGTRLLRKSPADYPDDGSGATILMPPARPNPRDISNAVSAQSTSIPNSRGMTNGTWQWGQFIDHDIDLTGNSPANGSATIITPGDPLVEIIPFNRSTFDSATGTSAGNPRQQINEITSYLDGSVVYGSNAIRAAALRTGVDGKLKMSGGGALLPLNTDDAALGAQFMATSDPSVIEYFVAGDVRANEQVGLTAIQTLFAREHNRLATQLNNNNSGWTDQMLYDTARSIVGAEIQAITYNEFLPAMLGDDAPKAQDYAYDSSANASITNEFSTALYRVGHTMLSADLLLAGDNGAALGSLALRDAFFNPSLILSDPSLVNHVLMGLSMSQSQEIDAKIVDDVRNFLFPGSGGVGIDLGALNIQRGRDHGLPDYNTVRAAYGLTLASNFADITSDTALQASLQSLYGTVDNVDVWVGALAEDHMPTSSVGELVMTGMVDQFTRLRDGDAFFYFGDASLQSYEITEIMDLESLAFMDIMVWNTELNGMPPSFFMGTPVPEPASVLLLVMASVAVWARRRSH